MKPGFQCLLHNNLHRRMCSIIISQQFTVEHQCATVVRKKGKCIDTIGRNFQIAGQHQTDISFHLFGDRYRFHHILPLDRSCFNIRTKITTKIVPYCFQAGLQSSRSSHRLRIRSLYIFSTRHIRRRTVRTERAESEIGSLRHVQSTIIKSRLFGRHTAVCRIAYFSTGQRASQVNRCFINKCIHFIESL